MTLALLPGMILAQTSADSAAIRLIIHEEEEAWARGDAGAYSRQFADDGTFTNIRGEFRAGRAAFEEQHKKIFATIFRGTTLHQDIASLSFVTPDVAVVEVLTAVSGLRSALPWAKPDGHGRLRTRLLQVVARKGGEWKIVAYHNVAVEPGVPVPDPR